jgi:hypothetical protein
MRQEGIIKGQFFDLDHDLAEAQRRHEWLLQLKRNSKCLEKIAHLVGLDSLYDRHTSGRERRELRLFYRGKSDCHDGALFELRGIEQVLKCKFGDIRTYSSYRDGNRPECYYEGKGAKVGKLKVNIRLNVKWLPPHCQLTVTKVGIDRVDKPRLEYRMSCTH